MNGDEPYFFVGGAVLVWVAMILWLATILPGKNRWNKRFLVALFTVFVLFIAACIVDLFVYDKPDLVLTEKIAGYFELLFHSLPVPMFTVFLLHTCGEDWRKSALFRTVLALWGSFFVLLGVAQFTTLMYYVTPENEWVRGPWFPLLAAPVVTGMLLNLAGVVQRCDKLPRKYFHAFLLHLLPLTVASIVHVFSDVLLLIVLCTCISTFSLFGIILYDQIEQYVAQQREIAHQRASIMVLQMRPHFIYNAMMSIYYLCALNPKLAQQVTMDFTVYLRKNFTALVSATPVPFSEELEHTRAYLAVEQVQYEDRLLVAYDTPHQAFSVPPLTLQPIVENAVKHGMDPESAPLCITIRTRKTDAGSEIVVEDNGRGFALDDAADDRNPHIALNNIRERLEMMCDGKLTIHPRKGGGTVVTVVVQANTSEVL